MATSIRPGDVPLLITPKPKRTGLIIGIVVAAVVVVIIIVVVVVVILSRRKRPGAGSGTGNNNALPKINCTTTSECTAPKVCNTSAQRCVDCTTKDQCTGAFPFCRSETNTCVKCLTSPDCGGGANTTCSGNICCNSTPPIINSVTSTVSGDTRIQINLEIKQPLGTSRVFVVLEDPTGFPLLSKTCTDVKASGPSIACTADANCPPGDVCIAQTCQVPSCVSFAAGPFVWLIASSIGIPLVTGASYRVKVKVVYDCGAVKNAATAFSAPFAFTIGNCATTPSQIPISSVEDPLVAQILAPGPVITFSTPNSKPNEPSSDFLVGILASKTENFHPNRAQYFVASTTTFNGPKGFKVATVQYPMQPFGIWYYRAFYPGQPGECSGPVSPAVRF